MNIHASPYLLIHDHFHCSFRKKFAPSVLAFSAAKIKIDGSKMLIRIRWNRWCIFHLPSRSKKYWKIVINSPDVLVLLHIQTASAVLPVIAREKTWKLRFWVSTHAQYGACSSVRDPWRSNRDGIFRENNCETALQENVESNPRRSCHTDNRPPT